MNATTRAKVELLTRLKWIHSRSQVTARIGTTCSSAHTECATFVPPRVICMRSAKSPTTLTQWVCVAAPHWAFRQILRFIFSPREDHVRHTYESVRNWLTSTKAAVDLSQTTDAYLDLFTICSLPSNMLHLTCILRECGQGLPLLSNLLQLQQEFVRMGVSRDCISDLNRIFVKIVRHFLWCQPVFAEASANAWISGLAHLWPLQAVRRQEVSPTTTTLSSVATIVAASLSSIGTASSCVESNEPWLNLEEMSTRAWVAFFDKFAQWTNSFFITYTSTHHVHPRSLMRYLFIALAVVGQAQPNGFVRIAPSVATMLSWYTKYSWLWDRHDAEEFMILMLHILDTPCEVIKYLCGSWDVLNQQPMLETTLNEVCDILHVCSATEAVVYDALCVFEDIFNVCGADPYSKSFERLLSHQRQEEEGHRWSWTSVYYALSDAYMVTKRQEMDRCYHMFSSILTRVMRVYTKNPRLDAAWKQLITCDNYKLVQQWLDFLLEELQQLPAADVDQENMGEGAEGEHEHERHRILRMISVLEKALPHVSSPIISPRFAEQVCYYLNQRYSVFKRLLRNVARLRT